MKTAEFDTTLGGTEQLPDLANTLKFAASRSVEIAAMTESILRPSKTKLIFQSLPVHMRRRVMSHNCKRLPRKLRQGHLEQLKKSGLPPKLKRPSRKYRRRPGNLLEEYNRRQRRYVWLETHVWHAKRFHMLEKWGYQLAYAPCDKAFRACYRASSAHCLMQDISYHIPIQISGPLDIIKEMFSSITSSACGLSIYAKAFTGGSRQGTIQLYKPNQFPFGYVGKANFIWVPDEAVNKTLWLFVHPSQIKEVESILTDIICSNNQNDEYQPTKKQRKLVNNFSGNIEIKLCPGRFNIFRLTGPNSHAILAHGLKCVENIEKIKSNKWIMDINGKSLYLTDKLGYWQSIEKASSPSQLPSRIVIGLVVKDPRLSRPTHRTKAKNNCNVSVNLESLITIPPTAASSPIWDLKTQDIIKNEKLSNSQFIAHVTKTQLVPGSIFEDDPKLQSVPVVLVQRPGSQDSSLKKIGYGSGWDIIIPSGYGVQFWQTFIMFGARSGGLRETENLAFEMGETYLPPDSSAGEEEEKAIFNDMKEKYFKLPPSKRVNYIKLGINSPFSCNWKLLLQEWSNVPVDNFYVLRDSQLLLKLQDCLQRRQHLPDIVNPEACLVPVYLQMVNGGSLKKHALICLPEKDDYISIENVHEQQHDDPNEKLRKQTRIEHKLDIKRWRRKRTKLRNKNKMVTVQKSKKRDSNKLSQYVLKMRELWLPSQIKTVRHSCSRQVMGYVSQGAFSFTESNSCGLGYIAYHALNILIKNGHNQILVRNISSKKYRLGNILVIKNC
ncbi:ribonucleases P/MRP protein subunit POP1 [Plodia interpunctella]|uniref:ribonucleases P/MRP protein subunit POP1 n=1 Tax=Plodia interpunctella TaxID=58824 RepID=UPI0023687606|nr:ribonucleases P/MRP protein subunit POP1 [Plodia interpunctella]